MRKDMSGSDAGLWESGYQLAMPLNVVLSNGRFAVCEVVVRAMPGRRYVCKGSYDGESVFIKLFSMNRRATREWKSEQQGISVLHEANIAAPNILYAGSNGDNTALVIIYAALPGAQSAQDFWDKGDETIRRKLLDELVELVAGHHAKGLQHTDLHLLNFIYSEKVIYTLDAGDINHSRAPLSLNKSISGLADLLALFPVEYDKHIAGLYAHYCQVRGIKTGDKTLGDLQKAVIKKRKYKLRKYLKKVFRSCSAFVALKSWKKYVVYDRALGSDALCALLQEPNQTMSTQDFHLLKDGNTCTVYEFEQDSRQLVCKRYNIKSIWHALSRAFRPSRGACSWKNSHHLLNCGIPTARPVALYEKRFWFIRSQAWFFMEKVAGKNLEYFLKHPEQMSSNEFKVIVEAACRLFEKMVREKISHGDMKISNFIFSNGVLYIIDLDSMKIHDKEKTFAKSFSRDMRRFFQNWEAYTPVKSSFYEALSTTIVAEYLPQ